MNDSSSRHDHPLDPERQARDAALAAFVPAGLPLWAACALDRLLPVEPWWRWASAEFWERPDIAAHRDDEARGQVERMLAGYIGPDHAAALMRYFTPVPWWVLIVAGVSRPRVGDDEH